MSYLRKLIGPQKIVQNIKTVSYHLGELPLIRTIPIKREKTYSWTALLEEIFHSSLAL